MLAFAHESLFVWGVATLHPVAPSGTGSILGAGVSCGLSHWGIARLTSARGLLLPWVSSSLLTICGRSWSCVAVSFFGLQPFCRLWNPRKIVNVHPSPTTMPRRKQIPPATIISGSRWISLSAAAESKTNIPLFNYSICVSSYYISLCNPRHSPFLWDYSFYKGLGLKPPSWVSVIIKNCILASKNTPIQLILITCGRPLL